MAQDRTARFALAIACALALGALTAYSQEWLPRELGSLANTSGSWALAAFVLARLGRDARSASLLGFLALMSLLAGYALGTEARGYATGASLILFWGMAALVAGPLVGLSSHWVKTRHDELAAAGVGAMSGVLIGEGVYGLTYILDTTYGPYWWGEIIVGLTLLGWVLARRIRKLRPAVVACGVGGLTAASFVLIYSQGLIGDLH